MSVFSHFDGQYRSRPLVSLRGASKQASSVANALSHEFRDGYIMTVCDGTFVRWRRRPCWRRHTLRESRERFGVCVH